MMPLKTLLSCLGVCLAGMAAGLFLHEGLRRMFQRGQCAAPPSKKRKEGLFPGPVLTGFGNGLLWALIFALRGWTWETALYCLMAWALLGLSIVDIKTMEIPPCFNLFLGSLGLLSTLLDGKEKLVSHLAGLVCVSGFLGLIYLLSAGKAIGGGDIKLTAACGLLLGAPKILLGFLLGCILGSIIHGIRMALTGAGHQLALGPYLSAGILISALWGETYLTHILHLPTI